MSRRSHSRDIGGSADTSPAFLAARNRQQIANRNQPCVERTPRTAKMNVRKANRVTQTAGQICRKHALFFFEQAGAKPTTDFGACRDLQGRRLRHVNDEVRLQKWQENRYDSLPVVYAVRYRLLFYCRRTIAAEVGVEELTGGRDISHARTGSVFIVGVDRTNRPTNGKTSSLSAATNEKTLLYVCFELASTG